MHIQQTIVKSATCLHITLYGMQSQFEAMVKYTIAVGPTYYHQETTMLIVDSQIHLWQNGKMSPHHRQSPTFSAADALAEMAAAGVDCAVVPPPGRVSAAATTGARRGGG